MCVLCCHFRVVSVHCVADLCLFGCAVYQMKFAVITPAIVAGSFAERVNFSGYIVFIVLFSLVVYVRTPRPSSPSPLLGFPGRPFV